jgi:T-complex protein 1 subunit alpha
MSLANISATIDGKRETGEDVRSSNVTACVALANIVKSSFGPMGLDKMIVDSVGDITISNDGATILSKLDVEHPAARVLVDLSRTQDREVGDGTTTVVILAAEFLKRGNSLVKKKIHPTSIISGFRVAMREATNFIRQNLSIKLSSLPNETLVNCAKTALSSKIICTDSDHFANIVVNALKRVGYPDGKGGEKYPVGQITMLKSIGRSAKESTLIEGYGLNCTVAAEGMPKQIHRAKIAFLDFSLERPSLPHGMSWKISDPAQLSAINKREENILKERIQIILKSGANVILTTGAIDDMASKNLVESGVMGVRRVNLKDLKNISRATGGQIILSLADLEGNESMESASLGETESVIQEQISSHELLIIRGTRLGKSASILLRGANDLMLEEMDRAVHDALMAVKRVLESKEVVPGGGCVETAVSMHLEAFAEALGTREQLAVSEFANAMIAIPKILAVNAAKDATDLVSKLCALHFASQTQQDKKHYARYGLELYHGKVQDNVQAGVLEPTLSKLKAIKSATEAAIAIMRIDDFISLNPKKRTVTS